jgi:hypothetical protein
MGIHIGVVAIFCQGDSLFFYLDTFYFFTFLPEGLRINNKKTDFTGIYIHFLYPYGTIVWVWPGTTTWITPPHWHINFELLLSAGWLEINTVGAPGTQGAVVTGTQGCGVNTPIAALVAAATAGLVRVVHIPKGAIFTMGLLSMILATGWEDVTTILSGKTVRMPGATPKLHCNVAPLHTANPIFKPPFDYFFLFLTPFL